ncbi:MAG: bifunctional metallophosphatase/5'-nucleotidase, partial [Bacteroidota bacterium]
FLARGGDDYPYGDDTFTLLGVSYQQALANYLETELGGTVSEADYPEIGEGRVVDLSAPFTLTILHNNDGESQLLGIDTDDDPDFEFGGIAHFATKVDELRAEAATMTNGSVLLTSGDNFLPGPEFNASLDDEVYYDAIGLDLIGYDGFAIGNHDFDFGPDVLAEFIGAFTETQPPFVSANLDFSGEANLQTLVDAGRIVPSTILNVGGQQVGVLGLTTPNLPFIATPGDVVVSSDLATIAQAQIDALEAAGVNKIILIAHLQGIEEDIDLIDELRGVDVVIAGGGDELLANDGDLLIPGDEDEIFDTYPITAQDADGNDVPVVTTRGNYSYVGRLVVEFDGMGNLLSVGDESGPVRIAQPASGEADAVAADAAIQEQVVDPVAASVAALQANVIANSEVVLNGVRGDIRSVETNLGNLIADAFLWQANELNDQFGAPAADVALANGGGIRNDSEIPAGELTEFDTFDILPFSNFITIVEELTPAQFENLLENAISRVEGGSGTGRFAQIAGFTYTYDADRQARTFDDDGNV